MTYFTTSRSRSRGSRETNARNARRAEQANLLAGLQTILEPDEQLLGFARGRIAGGFRGKLAIGPEAFFAPFVNIGLTDRRFILQHIHPENGKPSEILPHSFMLSEVQSLQFSDIETFGGEPACRLVARLTGEHFCRLRMRGALNFESAKALAEVFTSLISSRRSTTTPTQRVCEVCKHVLDQPYRFCPYCGGLQPEPEPVAAAEPSPSTEPGPDVEAPGGGEFGAAAPIDAEPSEGFMGAEDGPTSGLNETAEPGETPFGFAETPPFTPVAPTVSEVETVQEPSAVWPSPSPVEEEPQEATAEHADLETAEGAESAPAEELHEEAETSWEGEGGAASAGDEERPSARNEEEASAETSDPHAPHSHQPQGPHDDWPGRDEQAQGEFQP